MTSGDIASPNEGSKCAPASSLETAFAAAITDVLGPVPITTALSLILDNVERARKTARWKNIAACLSKVLNNANRDGIDPDTLRGLCSRLKRRPHAAEALIDRDISSGGNRASPETSNTLGGIRTSRSPPTENAEFDVAAARRRIAEA